MQELDDAIKNVSAAEYLFNTLLNDMMKPLYQPHVEKLHGNWQEYTAEAQENKLWINQKKSEMKANPDSFDISKYIQELRQRMKGFKEKHDPVKDAMTFERDIEKAKNEFKRFKIKADAGKQSSQLKDQISKYEELLQLQ